MKSQEVLLIGGMGYVGRQLQNPLADAGYTVHVLDKKPPQKDENVKIHHHRFRLSDEAPLKELLSRCGTVFYLASDSVPATTANHPSLDGELNVMPFLRFLDVLQACPDTHLLYVSSGGTVYGNATAIPINESCPVAPISYHGAGKAASEAFLHAFGSQSDSQITVFRPSNIYGPLQPYVAGFGIIRSIMEKLKREETLEILGDGEIVRDFLYIDDFVSACLLAMDLRNDQKPYRVFNVSSGQHLSINQLCEAIEAVAQQRLKRHYRQGRAIDVKAVVLDNSKIRNELGWHPVIEINEGLKRTWEWIKKLPL